MYYKSQVWKCALLDTLYLMCERSTKGHLLRKWRVSDIAVMLYSDRFTVRSNIALCSTIHHIFPSFVCITFLQLFSLHSYITIVVRFYFSLLLHLQITSSNIAVLGVVRQHIAARTCAVIVLLFNLIFSLRKRNAPVRARNAHCCRGGRSVFRKIDRLPFRLAHVPLALCHTAIISSRSVRVQGRAFFSLFLFYVCVIELLLFRSRADGGIMVT